jgi:hypothetical protein
LSAASVNLAALRSAAFCLRVDSRLVDLVAALRAESIEPVLLKGPVISRWLYADDPSRRPYVDIDILVSPADRSTTSAVLSRLGYNMQGEPMPAGDEPHARWFARESDAVTVDLHRTLHGMENVPT